MRLYCNDGCRLPLLTIHELISSARCSRQIKTASIFSRRSLCKFKSISYSRGSPNRIPYAKTAGHFLPCACYFKNSSFSSTYVYSQGGEGPEEPFPVKDKASGRGLVCYKYILLFRAPVRKTLIIRFLPGSQEF